MPGDESEEPVPYPITDEIDLHTFQPAEVAGLLEDYFTECQKRGWPRVRVVHGKGSGTLRETVHACLRRSPRVARFTLGDEHSGGWGATLVWLQPPPCAPDKTPPAPKPESP
ncbi:MAG: Smr/MutS family protein [Opitutaceae bacterium]|nr:Smr/MutS family protein [Opitutaceae bacterium]